MSNESRAAEAAGQTTTIPFHGFTFTVSTEMNDWSIDLLESIEEGKSAGICRGALGPEQWQQVRQLNLKVRDLVDLGDLISKALGFGSSGE